jgi:tryptophan 2,3-dioxygenase
MFEDNPEATKRLKAWMKRPTLWDGFVSHLGSRKYAVSDDAAVRKSVAAIYKDPSANDLMMLAEAMIELDEIFQLYREHHLRMAERMIGQKPGTGVEDVKYAFGKQGPMGTQGVSYLSSTTKKKFFPVLWEARTEL